MQAGLFGSWPRAARSRRIRQPVAPSSLSTSSTHPGPRIRVIQVSVVLCLLERMNLMPYFWIRTGFGNPVRSGYEKRAKRIIHPMA